MAGPDVKELLIRVNATTELLRSNLTQAESAIARFEQEANGRLAQIDKRFDALGGGLQKISNGFNIARTAAAGFIAGIGIQQITAAIGRALDYASSLGEVSQQLGVTTRDLQVYRYAATQVGIAQEEMDKALAKLTVNIGKAATGGKEQAAAFEKLGISVRDANGHVRSAGDIIPELADRLSTIPDAATRAAVEVELFGKSGQKLDTLLSGGRQAIDELTRSAEQLGVVLSDEQIQKADETADKLASLNQVLQARIAGVVAENADAILILVDALSKFATWAGKATIAWRVFLNTQAMKAIDTELAFTSIPGIGNIGSNPFLSDRQRLALLQSKADLADENLRLTRSYNGTEDPEARRKRVLGALPLLPGGNAINARSIGPTLDLSDFSASGGGGSRKAGKPKADPFQTTIDKAIADVQRLTNDAPEDLYRKLGIKADEYLDDMIERIDTEKNVRLRTLDEEFERRQNQEQFLARLFEDGFRGGAKAIWRDFESLGLQVISSVLAKFVLSNVNGGGGGFDLGGAITGAFTSILGFAGGGDPPVGRPSLVGERGPELFVPKVPGTVIPNHALGGTVNNFDLRGAVVTEELFAEMQRIASRTVVTAAPKIVQASTQATTRAMTRRRIS